jgi:large subunit ribosomal protein L10
MAKTRISKETAVRDYRANLAETKTIILADLSLLQVNDLNVLRRQAEKEQVKLKTVKKTLLNLALKQAGVEVVDVKSLPGSITLATCATDVVACAKVIETFRKTNDKVKFLGGVYEGQWLDAKATEAFAKTPSRQELLGMFVGVLQGNLSKLVRTLDAIKDAKSAA